MADTSSQHPFAAPNRARRTRTIIFVSAAVVIVVSALLLYTRTQRSAIFITGADTTYTVSLNGRTVTGEQRSDGLSIPVYSGVYRLKIERPNYLPFITDVRVEARKRVTLRPTFALIPSSTESAKDGITYVRPAPDQRAIYYLGDARKRLYRMEIANQVHIPMTEKDLQAVKDVQWSVDPSVVLIQQQEGTYLLEIPKFDFRNQSFVRVAGSEVVSVVWDPLYADRVAAAYFTPEGEKSLVLADKQFITIDRKADLSAFTNPKIAWSSDGKQLLVVNRAANFALNNAWVYNIPEATFKQVTTSGFVTDANFNLDGTRILYERVKSSSPNAERELIVRDPATEQETLLPIQTRLSQTAWKNAQELYAPNHTTNELMLVNISGQTTSQQYNFPSSISIQGMWYFPPTKALVFYTENAVFTITLE